MPVLCSTDASCGIAVALLMDAVTGVKLGILIVIAIGILVDVKTNDFAGAITVLEFPVSAPGELCR